MRTDTLLLAVLVVGMLWLPGMGVADSVASPDASLSRSVERVAIERFQPSASTAWNVDTAGQPEGLVVDVLAAQTRFVTDGSALTAAGSRALDDLLAQLSDYDKVVAVRIVGHTDSVGDRDYNTRLSLHRASFVKRLIEERLSGTPIATAGAGESTPIATNATAAGRYRNRRVEIRVVALGSVARLPAPASSILFPGERTPEQVTPEMNSTESR